LKSGSLQLPTNPPSTDQDPVTAYAWDVLHNKTRACRFVQLACERHFWDLERGGARGLNWRPDIALHRIWFFGLLRHSKGEWAGRPLILEPWQKFVVGSVFGWQREDKTRRFRTAYEEVPRKNGKSCMLAGIGINALVGDDEPGAEVYTAATRREQAHIILDEAKRMVRSSPGLTNAIHLFRNSMTVDRTASKFEALSADARTLDGLNPSVVLIDELHKHRNREVLDVLDTAMGSRRQPLLWTITTAGDDHPETVYAQERDYAERVLENVIHEDDADSHFVFITTVDKDDRWDDPLAWAKANPNLGVSVKLDDLKRQARKAANSPGALVEFKRLRLNLRTASADRFVDMDVWNKNTFCPPNTRPWSYCTQMTEELRGRRFYGGIDLSAKIDISAWIKLFPPEADGERWKIQGRFWMPAEAIEARSDRDQVQYRRWVHEGWIDACAGNTIDQNDVKQAVLDDCKAYNAESVAYDPWNAAQLTLMLQDEGVPVVEFIQGVKSYTAPTKELEVMLLGHKLDHGNNPVLKWMAANLAVQKGRLSG
jgi:phage terminase large subunit-like protein